MYRTVAPRALAIAFLGFAACKSGAGEAIKYVPESATFVAGIDIKGLRSTDSWKENEGEIKANGGEELATLDKCNVGLDKWDRVLIGGDGKSEKSVVVVVEGDGLGKKENLECLADADGDITVEDGGKVVKVDDDMVGYVVSDKMVAFTGSKWSEAVKGLVDGDGKHAGDSDLEDVIGRADTGKHIWFAGILPVQYSGAAMMFLGVSIDDVAGHMDFSDGLELKVAANTGSGDDAEAAKKKLQQQYDDNKDRGKQLGIPSSVVDAIEIDADGSAVTVQVEVSSEQIKKIEEMAKNKFGFGM